MDFSKELKINKIKLEFFVTESLLKLKVLITSANYFYGINHV
ncbi:hypothetical protein HPTD01_908 [Halomonas sp. TD01]|nr:hypothetical protein HPTD01_908 [Halomonas sp. TD01]